MDGLVLHDAGTDGGNYSPADIESHLPSRRLAGFFRAQMFNLAAYRQRHGDVGCSDYERAYCHVAVLKNDTRGPIEIGPKRFVTWPGFDAGTACDELAKAALWAYVQRDRRGFTPAGEEIFAKVSRRKLPIGKEEIGKRLGLTPFEWRDPDLDVRNITPAGWTEADLKRERREQKAARAMDRRAADGAIPRSEYLATALSQTKPWESLGFKCRRTWERHGKPTSSVSQVRAEPPVSQVRTRPVEDGLTLPGPPRTCDTPTESPYIPMAASSNDELGDQPMIGDATSREGAIDAMHLPKSQLNDTDSANRQIVKGQSIEATVTIFPGILDRFTITPAGSDELGVEHIEPAKPTTHRKGSKAAMKATIKRQAQEIATLKSAGRMAA